MADATADTTTDAATADASAGDASRPDTGSTNDAQLSLPVRHTPDPAAAERGRAALHDRALGPGLIPYNALRHIYVAWPLSDLDKLAYYNDAPGFWAAFRDRYGFIEDPSQSDLPMGLRRGTSGDVALECLACHAGIVAGTTHIGLANTRLDLTGLWDDLRRLPQAFMDLQAQPLPEPYRTLVRAIPVPATIPTLDEMMDRTGAAGVNDAFGLGISLSIAMVSPPPNIAERYGFQDPPPWWRLRFVSRSYTDGSGAPRGHRTMMATLLASGLDRAQVASMDAAFDDIESYLLSLPVPAWPASLPAIDQTAVARGRATFATRCAMCHGAHDGVAAHPGLVYAPADVGTDSLRAERFGPDEANWVNQLIADPANQMVSTRAYLAPPLIGVWATAPYLHNGSVPDLAALLTPGERPVAWRRTGDDASSFDAVRVGWRFDTVTNPPVGDTIEGRKVFDTHRTGLSNAGHSYGDDLLAADKADLIELLKTF